MRRVRKQVPLFVLASLAFVSVTNAEALGAPLVEEWLVQLGAQTLSSPTIAEVSGGGSKEIVISTFCPQSDCPGNPFGGGRVFVLTADGSTLVGWPQSASSAPFSGEAIVGDIDGDGDLEIVAGSWTQAFVWNHDGSNFPGWPKPVGTFVSPALADLDGDGDLEILYSSTDSRLFAWHHDGTVLPGWPYEWTGGTGNGTIMSPAVADIDGDRELEIVAGTGQGGFTTDPHDFFVWESDGTVSSGFPITSRYQQRPAAVGDVDADGVVEMVFSENRFEGQDQVFVVDSSGAVEPGWPVVVAEGGNSAPGLGDLDGDGDLEIAIGGAELVDLTCTRPRLFVFRSDGSSPPGFPVDLPNPGGGICPVIAPIVMADLNGDKAPEILVKYRNMVSAYAGDGSLVEGFPYALSDDGISSDSAPGPAVDDVDNDGELELVFMSTSGRVAYFDTMETTSKESRPWPMTKHDPHGTSDFGRLYVFSDGFESGDFTEWSSVIP